MLSCYEMLRQGIEADTALTIKGVKGQAPCATQKGFGYAALRDQGLA